MKYYLGFCLRNVWIGNGYLALLILFFYLVSFLSATYDIFSFRNDDAFALLYFVYVFLLAAIYKCFYFYWKSFFCSICKDSIHSCLILVTLKISMLFLTVFRSKLILASIYSIFFYLSRIYITARL